MPSQRCKLVNNNITDNYIRKFIQPGFPDWEERIGEVLLEEELITRAIHPGYNSGLLQYKERASDL